MRSSTWIATLLLIAGLTATAAAAPASPRLTDAAFLKSLGSPQVRLPEVGTPAPHRNTCSASNDCGDGNVAACTGSSTCQTTISAAGATGPRGTCPTPA